MSGSKKLLIGAGAAVLVLVIVVVSFIGYFNGIRNEGVKQENALEAQYQNNQNELSTYITSMTESLGVADKGANKLKEVLTEAVKGRYDGEMQPGTDGAMFSAITEAYPDLTATSESYAKVQDLVVSGRTAYKNQQTKLLDQIRAYETWSDSGIVRHMVVDMLGFPSKSLEARVGDTVYTGEEALQQMKRLVLTSDAVTSYETGETAPLIEPETTK